jgi:hypothetical protein
VIAHVQPNGPQLSDDTEQPQFGIAATDPHGEPWLTIQPPPHTGADKWQGSYYDATNGGPMGLYQQVKAGPCDLLTGKLTDSDWPTEGPWKQV